MDYDKPFSNWFLFLLVISGAAIYGLKACCAIFG